MPRLKFVPEGDIEDDNQPVIVPRNDKAIVTTSPERGARLSEHLSRVLSGSGQTADTECSSLLEPQGFAAHVARTACSLCQGWCCRNGGDDAFLDERTLARVRRARPDMDANSILQLYRERVPAAGYAASCIFHAKSGCTLDRTLRSDVCNSYFCGGLHGYMAGGDVRTPVTVFAGEGDTMRTSPMLIPWADTDQVNNPQHRGQEISNERRRGLARPSTPGHKRRPE